MASQHVPTQSGHNVPVYQADHPAAAMKHESIIIPFDSTPAFSTQVTCTIREKNCILEDFTPVIELAAPSGVTGATTLSYLPIPYMFTRVEIMSSGNTIDNLYPPAQNARSQLFIGGDEDRAIYNAGALSYNNVTGQTISAQSEYLYVTNNLFKECGGIPLLYPNSDITLRFYVDNLSNFVSQVSGTGTLASSIVNARVMCQVSRISPEKAEAMRRSMMKVPRHFRFHESRWQTFALASGSTAYSMILSSITGPVDTLVFMIRNATLTTAINQITYTQLSTWEILDQSSSNCVGGTTLSDKRTRLQLGRQYSNTSYLSESGAYIYVYSWSASPSTSLTTGQHLGSRWFTGSETLKINLASSLSNNSQVDVFAFAEATVELSALGMKKV